MNTERLIKCSCGKHFNPAFNDDTQPMYNHYCEDGDGEVVFPVNMEFEVVQYPIEPCPFCGGNASTHSDGGVQHYEVACGSCNASVKRWGSEDVSFKPVIDEWNKRV